MTLTAQDVVRDAKTRIREIGPDELWALQIAGTPVIDVREASEIAAGRIPGAVNIPRGVLEFEVDGHPAVNGIKDPALGHRELPVIVYCRSGGRSALAADALRRLGFRQPLSLAGGFQAWLDAGQAIAGD